MFPQILNTTRPSFRILALPYFAFTSAGVTPDQVRYYVDLLKKVRETPEWKDFMEKGAFNQTALNGKEYADWVAKEEARHVSLMKTAGFISTSK